MSSNSSSAGVGFFSLLALLFIGLKIAGVIDWSWWWVLAPIWVQFAIIGLIAVVFLFFYFFRKPK